MQKKSSVFTALPWLILYAALVFIFPASNASAQVVICPGEAIPDGYVFTETARAEYCPGTKGRKIELPHDNQWICVTSPIPNPFVQIGTDKNGAICESTGRSLIHTVSENIQACATTPVPSGWAIISNQSSGGGCVVNRVTLGQLSEGRMVCQNSPLPSGWAVTSIQMTGACGNLYSQQRVNTITDGITACSITSVPPEYVITRILTSNVCGGQAAYVLNLPVEGMLICGNSSVPPGWRGVDGFTVSNCGSYSRGKRLMKILP